nr:junctional adhesion molecule A isoform X2 [Chrysemys picta bellii]
MLLEACGSLISAQVMDKQTIQVTENKPIDLPCTAYVSQSGTPRVEWKFEKGSSIVLFYYNSKFTDPYKDRAQVTATGIRFTSVTRKDTGKYICEVLWPGSGGSYQLRKSEVDLIVQDGSPPPTCQCYRYDVLMTSSPKINEKLRNSCYAIDTKTGVLMNEPVTSFDTGDYFCEAQDNVGTTQKSEAIHLDARAGESLEPEAHWAALLKEQPSQRTESPESRQVVLGVSCLLRDLRSWTSTKLQVLEQCWEISPQ